LNILPFKSFNRKLLRVSLEELFAFLIRVQLAGDLAPSTKMAVILPWKYYNRTDVIRDVNWLTAVNDELLARVGGIEKARETLGDEVILHPYEGGVVFQAGERPVLGDLNKGRVPAAYRAVSDFLKPLRYENWDYPYLRAPYDVDEMEYTQWWTHRFDDDER